jgi:hypothetical protein
MPEIAFFSSQTKALLRLGYDSKERKYRSACVAAE